MEETKQGYECPDEAEKMLRRWKKGMHHHDSENYVGKITSPETITFQPD